MLEKRDKDRYKNALKDLKDYEIYKEVMETAMMRLQNELEATVKENQVSPPQLNQLTVHAVTHIHAMI